MLCPMKKLALLASLCIATPAVFACPGHDMDAPKTADTAETPKTADAKPAKATEKKDTVKKAEPKPADKADTAKKTEPKPDPAKKPDKVSQR